MKSLIETFRQTHATTIAYGCERNNCGYPVKAFTKYAKDRGYQVKQVYGDFKVDNPEYHIEDFTEIERVNMVIQGLDPRVEADRVKYAIKNNLVDELKLVPHYWNEINGQIVDFTAEAQFVKTGLASDTDRSRYIK